MSHKINTILFVILIVTVGLLNTFFHSNDSISELENKELQLFPEITLAAVFEDNLANKLDAFISDQFILRTPMIEISHSIKSLAGFQSKVSVSVVKNDIIFSPLEGEMENKVFQVGDRDVNYLVFEDRAFASFEENRVVEIEFAEAIKKIQSSVEGVVFNVLLAPTQASFVDKKYADLTDDQVASLNRFEGLLGSNITYINPYETLRTNYSDDLYFRTDHHWNGLGAYWSYVDYCLKKNLVPLELESMSYSEVPGFLGSVYKMTNDQNLAKYPDTIQAYTPDIQVTLDRYKMVEGALAVEKEALPYMISETFMIGGPSYKIFIGGDVALAVVKNLDDYSMPKILVVKDSYGNAVIPYLVGNYSEVYAVDPRHYEGNLTEFIKEKQIDEVLFINSANITRTSGFSQILIDAFE